MDSFKFASLKLGLIPLLFSGCCMFRPDVDPESKPVIAAFFNHEDDSKARSEKFKTYDLQTQYDILRWSWECVPGRHISHNYDFAEQGKPAADFLKGKLPEASDSSVTTIMNVFYWMSKEGFYDAGTDSELMTLMEKRIAKIKDDFWRRSSDRDLRVIRSCHAGDPSAATWWQPGDTP